MPVVTANPDISEISFKSSGFLEKRRNAGPLPAASAKQGRDSAFVAG
jgi:hypothetical protein